MDTMEYPVSCAPDLSTSKPSDTTVETQVSPAKATTPSTYARLSNGPTPDPSSRPALKSELASMVYLATQTHAPVPLVSQIRPEVENQPNSDPPTWKRWCPFLVSHSREALLCVENLLARFSGQSCGPRVARLAIASGAGENAKPTSLPGRFPKVEVSFGLGGSCHDASAWSLAREKEMASAPKPFSNLEMEQCWKEVSSTTYPSTGLDRLGQVAGST